MTALNSFVAALFALTAHGVHAQGVDGPADAPLAAEVLGTQVRTADPEELRYLVVGRLIDRYASERQIEVQQSEIDAYVATVARAMAEDRKQREAERQRLLPQLQFQDLSDAERAALSAQLAVLDELLAPANEDSAEDRAARQQVAAAFIRQWKVNRALYRQYGGRIIFQQGGPEPLDAYRLFLEEQQRQGAFEILNPSLEAGFWHYFRTDAIHSFYPSGSAEEQRTFDRPWWTREGSVRTP